MSLCDTCRDPGACCRRMRLNFADGNEISFWDDDDPVAVLAEKMGQHWFEPMEAVWRSDAPDPDEGQHWQTFAWRCTALGEDGRCTVYDNRPQLCRDYEPGSSPLCVHHTPASEAV